MFQFAPTRLMDWPLFSICLLTLVIHLIGALAYAARIAGVRRMILSFSVSLALFSVGNSLF